MTKIKKRAKPKREKKPAISPVMIGLVVVASVLIVAGLIILGEQSRAGDQVGPVDVSRFPAKGEINAPVTIIEYSDYG